MKKEGSDSSGSIEEKLAHNLTELQKVHITLIEKLDKLSTQLSSLFNVFELAAKNIADRPSLQETRAITDRIESLAEQNKTLAKSLSYMSPSSRDNYVQQPSSQSQNQQNQNNQSTQAEQNQSRQKMPEDEFKPSITSRPMPKL